MGGEGGMMELSGRRGWDDGDEWYEGLNVGDEWEERRRRVE